MIETTNFHPLGNMRSGGPNAKIGIVSTGKSYLDVREALDNLGLDEVGCNEQGLRILKVGMPWPLEPEIIKRFATDLDMIIVVEEKRALIETQIKEQLFNTDLRPVIIGKKNEHGATLFQEKASLEASQIGIEIGERLLSCDRGGDSVATAVAELKRLGGNRPAEPEAFTRVPYFCAGCPHSSSTKVPEGSRAYAGIGCHYMAKWMDRETFGFTHMGAEGANWIGEAPFTTRDHVFQNLGDGTYIHSGSLAIRAAIAAGVNITYKLLYNDAVAMTGGQSLDGGLTVGMMAQQVLGEGVKRVDIVTDEPDKYGADSGIPLGGQRAGRQRGRRARVAALHDPERRGVDRHRVVAAVPVARSGCDAGHLDEQRRRVALRLINSSGSRSPGRAASSRRA